MLIQGAIFIVLPNVPGAMFIQGGTFIPDSRVDVRTVYTVDLGTQDA